MKMLYQQVAAARQVAEHVADALPVVILKEPPFRQYRGFPPTRTGMNFFSDLHLIHRLSGILVTCVAYLGPF